MSRRQQRRRNARRRMHMAVSGGGLAAVASLGSAGVANAAQTFTVTNLTDCTTTGCGSLRAAINAVDADTSDTAAPGDSIVFASGLTGTINLVGSHLYVDRPAQITGPGASQLTLHAAANKGILYTNAPLKVSGLTFTGASTTYPGGAIATAFAPLEVDQSVITGNSAAFGAGIVAYRGDVTINQSTIAGNTAIGNTDSGGGGVLDGYGHLTINGSTISGNSASHYGGGAATFGGALTAIDSTISGNTAPTGAGLNTYFYGDEQLTGSTVAANTISSGGHAGQVFLGELTGFALTLDDSIVSGSGSTPDVELYGATGSASFSLVRNASTPSTANALATDGSDVTGLDPQLGPLAANGGPTETMALLPSSPVLDRGNAEGLTTDQRGLPRPFVLPTISFVPLGGDHSDIGAFEAETPAIGAIDPTSGNQGTSVGIVGVGFTGATQVLFGSTPAASFTVLGDGSIRAVAPAGAGPEDVRVVTPLGESPIVGGDRFVFPTFSPSVSKPHAKLSGKTVKTGIKVSCPVGGFSCSGSWKATATVNHHKTKLASGSISLSVGASKTITFKLGSKAMKQLKSKGSLKITIHIVAADGNGTPVTVNRTITLKYKAKKKH